MILSAKTRWTGRLGRCYEVWGGPACSVDLTIGVHGCPSASMRGDTRHVRFVSGSRIKNKGSADEGRGRWFTRNRAAETLLCSRRVRFSVCPLVIGTTVDGVSLSRVCILQCGVGKWEARFPRTRIDSDILERRERDNLALSLIQAPQALGGHRASPESLARQRRTVVA